MKVNNAWRADTALKGVLAFEAVAYNELGVEERETVITDLLADLMHLIQRENGSLQSLLHRAYNRYAEECDEEDVLPLSAGSVRRWR